MTGTVLYLAFAHAFAFSQPNVLLLVNVATASLALAATYFFEQPDLSYVANFFMYISLWTLLRLFQIDLMYYPFVFSAGSLAFYFASQLPMEKHYQEHAKNTALAVIGASPLVFGFLAYSTSGANAHYIERNSLITAAIATALYTLEAYKTRKGFFGYIASASFMVTLLWGEHFAGLTNIQYLALPTAVYFLILSYVQKVNKNIERRDVFDTLGLFVLFVPTFLQSLGPDGGLYSLLMGVEGVLIFALGTSIATKNYIYIGGGAVVVTVLIRMLNFISNLPAWITIGVGGLIFLTAAVYLLATRKGDHTSPLVFNYFHFKLKSVQLACLLRTYQHQNS